MIEPLPMRWQLLDEYSGSAGDPDRIVAHCVDVQGLFADPPSLPYERYTLHGCQPTGRLAAAIDRNDHRYWLGNVIVDSKHDPDRPPPPGCDCATIRCSCMEELVDVTVLGCRPSAHGDGLVDIDLEGGVRLDSGYTDRTPARRPDAIGFHLTGPDDDGDLGECLDISGLFVERPGASYPPAILVGCRPEPPLHAALAALAGGGSARRRLVRASLLAVEADGTVVSALYRSICATVTGVQPSSIGSGLVDVMFDGPVGEPLPARAREIWDLWYTGGPAERNAWAGYDAALRHEWAGAALAHHRHGASDLDARQVYHLDGRFVTDLDGFYCAIGEAVNGPGGYFGWNLSALHDCLTGGWGARTPFTLVWHDAHVAEQHLVPGYDRRRWATATTMAYLLGMLSEHGVEVELR
ncbi:barstar family protein [Catellatospora methionotrophica]|nr:barstar family protein [Catellatospora methionotrophica]